MINTKHRFFAKYASLNLIGQALVVLAGLYSIPILIEGLGNEKFGVLTLAWAVTGYFSIFDFGIGRAMTKLISERIGNHDMEEIPTLIWTGSLFMLVIGAMGGIVFAKGSSYAIENYLDVPVGIYDETLNSSLILATSIPIIISLTNFRGVLEAFQKFDLINYSRIPVGILVLIAPLFVLPFTNDISHIILLLVLIRILELILNIIFTLKLLPNLLKQLTFDRNLLFSLLNFGGWITLSNTIGPILSYLDRFLIGYFISLASVAFYTTPFELNMRLSIVPGAIVGVMFSAFGSTIKTQREKTREIFINGLKYTYILMYPLILFIIIFAEEGLTLWLNSDFASNSRIILQLLVMGSIFNSLTYIPSALIQASGRPDITAKLNLFELPVYIIVLILLLTFYGIVGAGLAYMIRALLDLIVLMFYSFKILTIERQLNNLFGHLATTLLILVFMILIEMSLSLKIFLFLLNLFISSVFGWKLILTPNEKLLISRSIKKIVFW